MVSHPYGMNSPKHLGNQRSSLREHRSMDQTFAALDLGSNSFHLLIVQVTRGEVRVIDRLRDRVRLAGGLMGNGELSSDVRERAIESLRVFGHRLSKFPQANVRAVGTNTLRRVDSSGGFLAQASEALGHPIHIISGTEEARLVYLGVSHDVQDAGENRLVVDIGGGSTECIIGRGDQILRSDSLYMGCVGYTNQFFPTGKITANRMEKAVVAARLEVGSVHRTYRDLDWSLAYGSSGTINAIQQVLAANGHAAHSITRAGLEWLSQRIIDCGQIHKLQLDGLKPERSVVFPGGVSILYALFRSFDIEEMIASSSALREGVIYDMIGRTGDDDVREETVRRMCERYGADRTQSGKVKRLIRKFANQTLASWGLDTSESRKMLEWAADLHEIGKAISYTGYHRHGSYLVAHSDMVGFSRQQQGLLAAMLLGQRRRLIPGRLAALAGSRSDDALKLTVLLRLASRLNRTRSPNPRPDISLTVDGLALVLKFPGGWLDERPMTRADLEQEATFVSQAGFTLTWD